ncbi:MAG: mannose-1-phosphate guanylyltransferase [Spirochaetota bacterium]|nr:mannose-1-phosphate guanylyltransferase [Spirochaetota bacterium]
MNIIPVILAGGGGTRLWPLSNEEKPKQFHNLTGNGTLLEETIKRLIPLNPDFFLVVTSKKNEIQTEHEINKIGITGKILAEPYPRNTAAATLYAAIYLKKKFEDSIMLILPADHYIHRNDEFIKILNIAINEAKNQKLVTLGLKPTYPETGYGYIKAYSGEDEVLYVDKFVEKPNIQKAKEYIENGNYFWNSGIFTWRTSLIIDYFQNLMPEHFKAFEALRRFSPKQLESNDGEVWAVKSEVFSSIKSISIDYGIMEKADNRVVIPSDFGWTDLGNWKSIDDVLLPDKNKNRTLKWENVILSSSKECTVFSENKRVAVIGLENVVIVESGNDILVMDKSKSQDVKEVVDIIKKAKNKVVK